MKKTDTLRLQPREFSSPGETLVALESAVERIGEVFGTEQSSARPVHEEQMLKRLSTRQGVEGTSPSQYGKSPGLRPARAPKEDHDCSSPNCRCRSGARAPSTVLRDQKDDASSQTPQRSVAVSVMSGVRRPDLAAQEQSGIKAQE
jgi:hypothetical protein